MESIHLLAAELFAYSYAHYEDHLGVNERFDRVMPRDAKILEKVFKEGWSPEEIAQEIDTSTENAKKLLDSTREALEVIDAENPAESFRCAVKQSIKRTLEKGLTGSGSIEELVGQICYRAADLGFLLDMEGHRLSQYSRHLRREPDTEYDKGYFEEPFKE